MSALLSDKQAVENLIREYRLFASLSFNPELYPVVQTEELALETCE